jgi:hypothetical protein
MAKVLNLDKLIPDNRSFILDGKEYIVPGGLSVKQVVSLTKIGQEIQEKPEKLIDAINMLWDCLAPFNKDKTLDEFSSRLSSDVLGALLNYVFNNVGGEDKETEVFDNSKNASGQVQ